jgi:hypothetical protein
MMEGFVSFVRRGIFRVVIYSYVCLLVSLDFWLTLKAGLQFYRMYVWKKSMYAFSFC